MNEKIKNLNLFFNKIMYENLKLDGDEYSLGKFNPTDEIPKKRDFTEDSYNQLGSPLDERVERLYFKTTYPGLAVGLGYAHGVKKPKTKSEAETYEDYKLGFSFDYVTGQPYIPGSSVKGVLRHYLEVNSVFDEFIGTGKTPEEQAAFIGRIFGGDDSYDTAVSFLDAVVKHGDTNGKVIGNDSITPHEGGLKNPVPLQFIKVLPDVVFEFRLLFLHTDKLADGTNGYKITENFEISTEKLIEAFANVLETFGIGSKTNVGYGALLRVTKDEVNEYKYPREQPQNCQKTDNRQTKSKLFKSGGFGHFGNFADQLTGVFD